MENNAASIINEKGKATIIINSDLVKVSTDYYVDEVEFENGIYYLYDDSGDVIIIHANQEEYNNGVYAFVDTYMNSVNVIFE